MPLPVGAIFTWMPMSKLSFLIWFMRHLARRVPSLPIDDTATSATLNDVVGIQDAARRLGLETIIVRAGSGRGDRIAARSCRLTEPPATSSCASWNYCVVAAAMHTRSRLGVISGYIDDLHGLLRMQPVCPSERTSCGP